MLKLAKKFVNKILKGLRNGNKNVEIALGFAKRAKNKSFLGVFGAQIDDYECLEGLGRSKKSTIYFLVALKASEKAKTSPKKAKTGVFGQKTGRFLGVSGPKWSQLITYECLEGLGMDLGRVRPMLEQAILPFQTFKSKKIDKS